VAESETVEQRISIIQRQRQRVPEINKERARRILAAAAWHVAVCVGDRRRWSDQTFRSSGIALKLVDRIAISIRMSRICAHEKAGEPALSGLLFHRCSAICDCIKRS